MNDDIERVVCIKELHRSVYKDEAMVKVCMGYVGEEMRIKKNNKYDWDEGE